jgi:hypothetical protein
MHAWWLVNDRNSIRVGGLSIPPWWSSYSLEVLGKKHRSTWIRKSLEILKVELNEALHEHLRVGCSGKVIKSWWQLAPPSGGTDQLVGQPKKAWLVQLNWSNFAFQGA